MTHQPLREVVRRCLRRTLAYAFDAQAYATGMKWTQLELNLLARISRYPRSMTPRERTFKLATLRTLWVSVTLLAIGFIAAIAGAGAALPGPLIVGTTLFLFGIGLLLISMILMLVVVVVFGD